MSKKIVLLTETERATVAATMASVGRTLNGRVPDRIIKLHHRLTTLLQLPAWQCGDEQSGPPLSSDEINAVLKQLDAVEELYNGRVPAHVIDASLKLRRRLWSLAQS